jgi:archaellum component FlaC
MDPCTEKRRFENIESDVKELKDITRAHSNDIIALKEGHAETRIYVKQIFERIDDLKVLFKTGTNENNSTWSKIVMELIKAIAIIAGIVAGVKLL